MSRQSTAALAATPPRRASKRAAPTPDLTPAARAKWNAIVAGVEQGHFHTCDFPLLAVYAESLALYDQQRELLAKEGAVLTVGKAPRVNPRAAVLNNLGHNLSTLAQKLGVCPSCRKAKRPDPAADLTEEEVDARLATHFRS
jgi:phage terminase small subunit